MSQSYKVFIGSSFIQFGNEAENNLVFNTQFTDPSKKILLETITQLEKESTTVLILGNTEVNWINFRSHFALIEAAGGLVSNTQGDWLFIYRNDMWDLPKGKLEAGEKIEECAVREVAEECGIDEPVITKPLSPTYHTYLINGKRILKPTYWFLMKSTDPSLLTPQTEEGITDVRWVPLEEAKALAEQSFGSIKQVVNEGLSNI